MIITWHEPGWVLRWRCREGESRADENVKAILLPRLKIAFMMVMMMKRCSDLCSMLTWVS